MSMHAHKSWTGHVRVAMGELDHLFHPFGSCAARVSSAFASWISILFSVRKTAWPTRASGHDGR